MARDVASSGSRAAPRPPDRRRRGPALALSPGPDARRRRWARSASPRRRSPTTRTSTRRRSAAISRTSASSASAASATRSTRCSARSARSCARRASTTSRSSAPAASARRSRARRSSPSTASTSPRSSTPTQTKIGVDLGGVDVEDERRLKDVVREKNIVVGVLAVPATRRAEGRRRSRRRRRAHHLQLLGSAARRPGRRDGAHVEPRGRAAARALLPPDVAASAACDADPSLARLPARRHGLERLHPRARARVEPRRARGRRRLPGARAGAVRPRRRAGRRARSCRAGCCRCSCSTATPGSSRSCCRTSRAAERRAYVEANAAALRELLPADLVFTNHVLLGGPVGAATGAPFRVKAHGSELEYSMRGRPELERWGRESLAQAEATLRRLASTSARCSRTSSATSTACSRCRPASTSTSSASQARDEALAGAGRGGAARPAEPRQRAASACPTSGNAERLAAFLAGDEPTVVYFGKLIEQKGVQVLLEAMRDVDARLVVVGFGPYRAELERARAAAHALHRPARAPPPRAPAAARRRDRRAVDLPRGVRHGRGRGRRRRLAAARRAPLRASPRSRPGSRRSTRSGCGTSPRSRRGDAADLRRKLEAILALPARRPRRAAQFARAGPSSERWSWASVAATAPRARLSR